MSKGIGINQKIILGILICFPKRYFPRNGLAYALGNELYPKLKEEDLKPEPKSEDETHDLKKEKLKYAITSKDRSNKIIDRILRSLKDRGLIEMKNKGFSIVKIINHDLEVYKTLTEKDRKSYAKITNFGLDVWKTLTEKEGHTKEFQKKIIEMMYLSHLALNFSRRNLNRGIITPIKIREKRETPLLDHLEYLLLKNSKNG